MKKIFTLILLVFVLIISYFCENKPIELQRIEVTYDYTVDGDTVYLVENGKRQKYRLLYVDTPEATTEIEPFGLEATQFTKRLLENASTIEIEYQEDNEIKDQYDRCLVWLFVDGKLLQTELAKAGLVEDFYDNGKSYHYKKEIIHAMQEAKDNKLGLYSK